MKIKGLATYSNNLLPQEANMATVFADEYLSGNMAKGIYLEDFLQLLQTLISGMTFVSAKLSMESFTR